VSDEAKKKDPDPPEPMPWDRMGIFLGDMALVAKNMADRNLKVWSTLSEHLRDRPYTMDDWADDAASSVEAAMSNAQDTLDFIRRAPERERVADTLPTAFMLIAARYDNGKPGYTSADPVWMRVPPPAAERLPATARISLAGDNPDGVEQLRESLSTRLGASRQAYLLEVTNVNDLLPGTYSGTVYLTSPNVRPIANLRVIVEDPVQAPSEDDASGGGSGGDEPTGDEPTGDEPAAGSRPDG
jgi:hypothetical protein